MIFSEDRTELRRMYREAWQKHSTGQLLSPLEAQIVAVVEWHPEYHNDVTKADLDTDYLPDGGKTNPFLHMGLHLGVREQVATDRPPGIAAVHAQLLERIGDPHHAEHQMIEALAETLWEAQSAGTAPDENKYLLRLQNLAGVAM